MKTYTFNKTDRGIYGDAFEMAIKNALGVKDADRVSPKGKPDFRFNRKCYDAKQNATCIQYAGESGYIKGSSRVIYAPYIAYTVEEETALTISISVDLANTEFFVLERDAFVEFLLATKGAAKRNESRGDINIQTVYNYTKRANHGKLYDKLTAWAYENALDDPIIDAILENA